jgi:four helix bundle protein
LSNWLADVIFRTGDAPLRDQAVRTARSVVLKIAEGYGKTGGGRRHSYTLALDEPGEACSAIEIETDTENAIDTVHRNLDRDRRQRPMYRFMTSVSS